MYELETPPSWKEFTEAVNGLTNDKSPGLNRVPRNAFKAMSPKNMKVHFNFILEFWNDDLYLVEFLKVQVIIPKCNNEVEVNFQILWRHGFEGVGRYSI